MKIEKTQKPVPKRAKERASNKSSGGIEKTPKKLSNGRGTDSEGKTRKRRSASAGHDFRDKRQAKDPPFALQRYQKSLMDKLNSESAPERHHTRYGGGPSGPNYAEPDSDDGERNDSADENEANAPAANNAPAIEAGPGMVAHADGNGLQMPMNSLFNREQPGPSGRQQNPPVPRAEELPPLIQANDEPDPPENENAPALEQAGQPVEYPGNWADWVNGRLPDNPPLFGLDAYDINGPRGRRRQLRWSRSTYAGDDMESDLLRGTLLVSLNRYHGKVLEVVQRDQRIDVLNEAITTRDRILQEQRQDLLDECQRLRNDDATKQRDLRHFGTIIARTRRRAITVSKVLENFIEKNPGIDTSKLNDAITTLKERHNPSVKQGNKIEYQYRILIDII